MLTRGRLAQPPVLMWFAGVALSQTTRAQRRVPQTIRVQSARVRYPVNVQNRGFQLLRAL